MSSLPYVSLVTLASVKEWLNTSGAATYPPNSDALLQRMIGAASRFASSYLSRPIAPVTVTETYNGTDRQELPLRQRPVVLVRSVTVGTTAVPARPGVEQSGFSFDDSTLYLAGYVFRCGPQNVSVTYDAGYQFADAWTVPASATIDASDLARPWNSDRGVAYASGAALTKVTSAPTLAGTYQVTVDPQGTAEYVFASGDVGASIVITYGYTPEDIGQSLIELIAERFKTRSRIGETSQNIKGMVVAFSQKDMNESIRTMLNQYRQVVPV